MKARNARKAAHRLVLALATLASLSGGAACGSRSPYWDLNVDASHTYGMEYGVVVVDDPDHRLVLLTSNPSHTLAPARTFPIGHGFTSAAVTPGGQSLLVLSAGDWPPVTGSDELPSLTLLSLTSPTDASTKRFKMTEPLSTLAIDPQGRYAVAYQGTGGTQSFTTNPNEIVIFDLTKDPADAPKPNPTQRTLRSFGGIPQRLTFSPQLNLPARAAEAGLTATPRRLLVVETTIDVCIVDLDHAFDLPKPPPDITVRLTAGTSSTQLTPAGLAIDANPDDGRLALRTAESTPSPAGSTSHPVFNVFTMQLVPAPPPSPGAVGPFNDFTPSLNLTDVGGLPTDVQFVNTSDGLRVAALVPSTNRAILFEPDTSATTAVDLPAAYSNLSLVTSIVTGAMGAPTTSFDVAMLWTANPNGGTNASGIALWTLDNAVGQPYRSIEVLSVADPIASVIDVPKSTLKVLTTALSGSSGHAFYVLDLVRRTPSPIDTRTNPSLSMSPDGQRLWDYVSGGNDLASVALDTLNPTPLLTDTPISSVFDIAADKDADKNPLTVPRTLVAVHSKSSSEQAAFGVTTFDARLPLTATSHRDVALLLEAP